MASEMSTVYETRLFIDNKFVPGTSKETITVRNPFDDTFIASVPCASTEDVDLAVASAKKAFYSGEWSTFTGVQRAKCLFKLAELLEAHTGEIARLETIAMGTPISITTMMGYGAGAAVRYYASLADKIGGESFPDDGDNMYKIIQYEPLGVCVGLASFNASPVYVAHKAGPALAAGNTVVFKASEKTPLGVLRMAPLFAEAGFPPGVVNFVSGGAVTGAALASHMDVRKISFTGSALTGKKIMVAAAQSNLKRVTLELGGKGSAIVFEDADLDVVATNLSDNFLRLTGQICHSSSRLLVHESVAEKVLEMLKGRYEAITKSIGKDPMEKDTKIGPLADGLSLERATRYLDSGAKNAELVTGGTRLGEKGCFVSPTIFYNPKSEATIFYEEIFGPVLTVKTFTTPESAIGMANNTETGLAASVYTRDMALAMRVAKKLEVGTVSINSSLVLDMNSPFGGKKASGMGREVGQYGLKDYLEAKTIKVKLAGFN